jgi:hypothetical protein
VNEHAELLASYDETMRRRAHPAGLHPEYLDDVSRYTSPTGTLRYVMWHSFAEENAAHIVARELASAAQQVDALVWKLYGHDRAHDALASALVAQGAVPEEPSMLMMMSIDALRAEIANSPLTSDLIVRQLVTPESLDVYQTIWDQVWPDADNARYANDYRELLRAGNDGVAFFATFDANNDAAVSSGYCFHNSGDPIALLCGGATVRAYRNRRSYRHLIAARANYLAKRGATHLAVEASHESEPILARLGFRALSKLTFFEKSFKRTSERATA